MSHALIRDAFSAGLVECSLCDAGFRRVGGVHIGSQRLGMILDEPCARVFVVHGGAMTEDNDKPWMAHVDGDVLRKKSGDARRFKSPRAAFVAAQQGAPRMWHP